MALVADTPEVAGAREAHRNEHATGKTAMKLPGYTLYSDGLFRKLVEFPQGRSVRREVLVRDRSGHLVRVERGRNVRTQ